MKRMYLALAALAVVALLAIAGCGGGGGSSSSSESASSGASESESSGGGAYGNEEETEPAAAEEEAEPAAEEEAAAKVESEETEMSAAGGATAPAVVKVMKTSDLGEVIVNAEGMTMYDFHKDKGGKSACYGKCAEAWPPLLTKGAPKAMGGAESSLLGVTMRKDGTEQVTYNGHPLYGFIEDQKPGETNGNDVDGFGAQWYALLPNGEEPEDS